MNKLTNEHIQEEIDNKISKLLNYYMSLQQLVSIYLEQLLKFIEDKNKKELLETKLDLFQNLHIKKIQTKIESNKILDMLKLYNDLLVLNDKVSIGIKLIKSINIFDEKTLLSDTSKNNINQNKMVILDMYNKITSKLNLRTNLLIEFCQNSINLDELMYNTIHSFYIKNPLIITLYSAILKKYLNDKSDDLNDKLKLLILYNNDLDKNKLLIDSLYSNNSSSQFNMNSIKDFNYLLKNSPSIIKNNNNISKYYYFNSNNKYISLQDLFKDIQNSNFQIKSNELTKSSLQSIQNIVNDLYKIEKQYLNITIIESDIEKFNYNCHTLLKDNFKLNKDIGINNKYINKTKTIVNELEYNNLEKTDSEYKNDMYMKYFNKIYNINNFQYTNKRNKNDNDNLHILLESQYLLIIKLRLNSKNYEFHIMQHSNDNNIYMNFNQIKELLQNKPNYLIENYNIYRNNELIKNIENNNMLNDFQSKIASDYKNLTKNDNLELKNQILNKIKSSLKKINKENKENNINTIINIIIDKLYNYIKTQNNIEFSSEIYLTYYSNISNLINKIRKELTDNYNSELLSNIDNILNNIYSNILTINHNILDKYYLTQL